MSKLCEASLQRYLLARGRALKAQDLIVAQLPDYQFTITPAQTAPTQAQVDLWVTNIRWNYPSHEAPNDSLY